MHHVEGMDRGPSRFVQHAVTVLAATYYFVSLVKMLVHCFG